MNTKSLFPSLPQFTGQNAPSRLQCDLTDLEIEGAIPPALEGTWYRCGPDPMFPPMIDNDLYVNGDGLMSAFRFHQGRVDYRARYVQTEKFLAERDAHRALFGRYRNPFTDDPSVQGLDRGTANTTAFWHGGRLFALKEDSLPYELDPDTLETRGRYTFGGKLQSRTATAHPKLDPVTGEWIFFGYEANGLATPDVAFCVANADGELVREDWFKVPFTSFQHDFAVTRDYVVFPVCPTIADLDRMKAGGAHWEWDGSKPTYVAVLPRNGHVSDMRWFKAPSCNVFHVVNGFNEGSTVHVDLCVSKRNAFPDVADVSGAPFNPEDGAPFITRWTFDMAADGENFTSRVLSSLPGELPRIDERHAFKPTGAVFYGALDNERSQLMAGPQGLGANTLARLDARNGALQTLYIDDHTTFQEPQFVPAGDGSDDGYVLVVVDHHDTATASVLVLDAAHIDRPPVARIRLPMRLRDAFHGTWVPHSARATPVGGF
ncbi:carotenoid oxygenase family protein [Burkholderia seminalis]|uniref:carotenoid oxygenase family protein n=1 Tax=Burkholderia seminalis TaxID=488731 RepID=UPI00084EFA3F|nr:carotenoid oxygenase family protein [Burkholderia seminalis]